MKFFRRSAGASLSVGAPTVTFMGGTIFPIELFQVYVEGIDVDFFELDVGC